MLLSCCVVRGRRPFVLVVCVCGCHGVDCCAAFGLFCGVVVWLVCCWLVYTRHSESLSCRIAERIFGGNESVVHAWSVPRHQNMSMVSTITHEGSTATLL